MQVLLLESRDRLGGRIHTDYSFGCPVDMGASWWVPVIFSSPILYPELDVYSCYSSCISGSTECVMKILWLHWFGVWGLLCIELVVTTQCCMTMIWKGKLDFAHLVTNWFCHVLVDIFPFVKTPSFLLSLPVYVSQWGGGSGSVSYTSNLGFRFSSPVSVPILMQPLRNQN